MRLSSHKTQRETKMELQMTSMIDVVFLLLIFFIVTSSYILAEQEDSANIQTDKPSAKSQPSDLERAVIVIEKRGSRFVYRLGSRDIVSARELRDVLRKFPNKDEGAFIRPNDNAPFAMAAAAVQAAKAARFFTVTYEPLSE